MAESERPIVLVVCTNADQAGTPIHVLWLLENLRDRFHFYIVFGEYGLIEQKARALGVQVQVVSALRSSISLKRDLRAYRELREIIRRIDPALIHAHGSKSALLVRLICPLFWSRRVLYTVHGWGFGPGRPRIQSGLVRLVEFVMARFAPYSRYIFVSHADQGQGRSLGIAQQRGAVIWNSVADHGHRAAPEQSSSVLMAARVAFQKDHATLLQAFALAPHAGELVLVGAGTETSEFGFQVERLAGQHASRVVRLGVRSDVPHLLGSVGLFALSSRYEGLPLAVLEAMCAGLPVVASDVGGNRELVTDGVNGYLVPAGDFQRFAECLTNLQDAELRRSMGAASRQRYERDFSSNSARDKTLMVYASMLQNLSATAVDGGESIRNL